MSGRLQDRVAMVIGGSSGISRAVALRFAEEGASVAVGDIREEPREGGAPTAAAIASEGGDAVHLVCDLTDEESTAAAFADTVERYGRVDVVFIGAGVVEPTGDTRDVRLDDFDRHMAINVRGTFIAVQQALRVMVPQGFGRIIPIASNFGQVGVAGLATYCAAKAAVIGLVRSVAVEVGQHNVTVNALCPGATKTQINAVYRADPETQELWRRMTPLRMTDGEYVADPSDMAAAALYLASDEARFMTGSCLTVDGGWVAH